MFVCIFICININIFTYNLFKRFEIYIPLFFLSLSILEFSFLLEQTQQCLVTLRFPSVTQHLKLISAHENRYIQFLSSHLMYSRLL